MGRFLCPPCRIAKKGFEVISSISIPNMQCIPDPNDPSRCSECKRRGFKCGERTWGPKRAARMSQEATENRVRSMEQWSAPENGDRNDLSTPPKYFICGYFADLVSSNNECALVTEGSATISHPSTFTHHRPARSISGDNSDPKLPPAINATHIDRGHERSERKRRSLAPTRNQQTLGDDAIGAKAVRILQLQWPGLDLAEINSSVRRAVSSDNARPIHDRSSPMASDHGSALDSRSESMPMSLQESGVSTQLHSGIQQLATNVYNHWDDGFLNSVPYINWLGYVSLV